MDTKMGNAAPFTFVDLANIFVMILALVSFFIMIILLLRNMAIVGIVGETDIMNRMGWIQAHRPPRLLMQRVHIPFTFKLLDPNKTTYQEVTCIVSSEVRYEMSCWWGAPVRELHHALWTSIDDVMHTDSLRKYCAKRDDLVAGSPPHSEKIVTLKLEEPLDLGAPPRARYPLVVVLAMVPQDVKNLAPDDIVALIYVVHIQDKVCPLPSGILTQYLKQANGQLSDLKQLYLTDDSVDGETRCEGCCVCTARPLSRALLPCRHACLCSGCLLKLDKCPICRSPIQSYFCISADEEPSPPLPAPSWSPAPAS